MYVCYCVYGKKIVQIKELKQEQKKEKNFSTENVNEQI